MTNEDLTTLILDKLGWLYDKALNPSRYSNTTEILAGDLIYLLLEYGTTPKAAKALGVGQQTLNRIMAQQFVPLFGHINGGGETWKFKLITHAEHRKCADCKEMLPFSAFDTNNYNSTGKHSYCRKCRVAANAVQYKKESTQEAHKRSQELHYHDIRARNALYRIERSRRNVPWADLDKIKEVYKNCPSGMHVDHVIPLKGELVSGLHVHNNLQYLTPEENIRKSNSFSID